MTFVQFANDECDYGMGLELGMDLFCYGSHVSSKSTRLPTSSHLHYMHVHYPSSSMGSIRISKETVEVIFKQMF